MSLPPAGVQPPAGDRQPAGDRAPTEFPQPTGQAWQLKSVALALDGPLPRLMGIVNVTPDSFSDGGRYADPGRAVEHALQLADEGADILDIGGESTRPYSTPVDADEERQRVIPVISALARQTPIPLSIDTSKASVAAAALEAGAQIVNDISGLEGDPQMLPLVARHQPGVCLMHMRGTPQTMQDDPRYGDLVGEILAYLKARRQALLDAGVCPTRLTLDPGIGFGKTHEHNLELLRRCGEFHAAGSPLLVGHSRKGFIAKVLGDKQADRTPGTIGVALALARARVQILRVHDVAAVRQALLLFAASGGLGGS